MRLRRDTDAEPPDELDAHPHRHQNQRSTYVQQCQCQIRWRHVSARSQCPTRYEQPQDDNVPHAVPTSDAAGSGAAFHDHSSAEVRRTRPRLAQRTRLCPRTSPSIPARTSWLPGMRRRDFGLLVIERPVPQRPMRRRGGRPHPREGIAHSASFTGGMRRSGFTLNVVVSHPDAPLLAGVREGLEANDGSHSRASCSKVGLDGSLGLFDLEHWSGPRMPTSGPELSVECTATAKVVGWLCPWSRCDRFCFSTYRPRATGRSTSSHNLLAPQAWGGQVVGPGLGRPIAALVARPVLGNAR